MGGEGAGVGEGTGGAGDCVGGEDVGVVVGKRVDGADEGCGVAGP